MITRTIAVFGLAMSIASASVSTQGITDTTAALSETRDVRAALDAARADVSVTDDQIRFCEIPAPPFKEERRANALKLAFEQLRLADVRIDNAETFLALGPVSAHDHMSWSPRASTRCFRRHERPRQARRICALRVRASGQLPRA
jgi:hypothetical protein